MILICIIISSLKLIVDTYISDGSQAGNISNQMDVVFNIIFAAEAFLKIIAYGFVMDNSSYLTDTWS